MYANHRHYILFSLALLAFVIATLVFFLLRKGIYDQAVLAADLKKQVNALEQLQQHEREVNNAYTKFNEEKEILANAVVTEETVVNLIEAFEKIGTDTTTEIELSQIQTQEIIKTAKIQDNFGFMKARAEVKGKWSDVMRALVLIENIQYGITFDNLSLSAEPSGVENSVSSTTTPVQKRWRLSLDMSVLMTN